MRAVTAVIFIASGIMSLKAQPYPPAAGVPGTTAIYKDSSVFVSWASGCAVKRGPADISVPSAGNASVGDSSMATGKALANGVVSLGDGGSATCTFPYPVTNGPGFDFAVFENSIDDTFLELAFVEVSSDGQSFFRFPSHSLTDTTVQTSSFGATDPGKIHNLAGKYRAGYGTPFDLAELDNIQGLDIGRITHIRIKDVVGSIAAQYCTRDSKGNKVNDPWNTPFPSSGFDLDAVGVIHQDILAGLAERSLTGFRIYPNPVHVNFPVMLESEVDSAEVADQFGNILSVKRKVDKIDTGRLRPGLYYLRITQAGQTLNRKLIVSD